MIIPDLYIGIYTLIYIFFLVIAEAFMSKEKSEADKYGKNQSEYDQNINGLAKYFYKNKIYTKPFVFVRTLPTLRK